MAVRIGANPIGWSNDDMRELGGATPLEVCLAEAKEAGFAGMELGHKFPREPKALAAVLGQFGLSLVSGWYSAELLRRDADTEMRHLRPHLDLLKALGRVTTPANVKKIAGENWLRVLGDIFGRKDKAR